MEKILGAILTLALVLFFTGINTAIPKKQETPFKPWVWKSEKPEFIGP